MPPTRAMTFALYNLLAQQLRDGIDDIPYPGESWLSNCWGGEYYHPPELVEPYRLEYHDFEYLKAAALTLDNELDFDDANEVSYAHEQLYSETVKATEWKQCSDLYAYAYQAASIPAYCYNQCTENQDNGVRGPAFEARDARDAALSARLDWQHAIEYGDTQENIDALESIANSKAATHRSLSRSIWGHHPAYKNIWNFVPNSSGQAIGFRFNQHYKPSSGHHTRWYQFVDDNMTVQVWWKHDNHCDTPGWGIGTSRPPYDPVGDVLGTTNHYEFESAPDGGYILTTELPLFRADTEWYWCVGLDGPDEPCTCLNCIPPEYTEGPVPCCSDKVAGRSTFTWVKYRRGGFGIDTEPWCAS